MYLSGKEPFEIAAQQIDLNIHEASQLFRPEGRHGQRVRNEADGEAFLRNVDDGEAHPVHGDGPFGCNVDGEVRGEANPHPCGVTQRLTPDDPSDAVYMSGDEMPSQEVSGLQWQLEIDLLLGLQSS